jgi:hypothetical protein
MTQHYPRGTTEANHYCSTCDRFTRHRVDFPSSGKGGGRVGPCLECLGFKIGRYLFDAQPKCFHCDAPFPTTTKAEMHGLTLILQCPKCGCMTPFKFEEKLTKAQQSRRQKQELERQNPPLFPENK